MTESKQINKNLFLSKKTIVYQDEHLASNKNDIGKKWLAIFFSMQKVIKYFVMKGMKT